MSDLTFFPRTLDQAIAEAVEIVQEAKVEHRPTKTFLLFSGGNDSQVLLHALAQHADAIVHVDTTIGMPEVSQFCRSVASAFPIPYLVYRPVLSYRELVLTEPSWRGLPGPGAHRFAYNRLKERCFEALLRDHRRFRGERFLLLGGIRRAESSRRSKRGHLDRKGGRVWASPLLDFTNDEMAEYRQRFDLPRSEVSDNLHMSGECLCGAMADQGPAREERAMIRFFYPEIDRRIARIEAEARALGLPYDEWGVKRSAGDVMLDRDAARCGELDACQSCAWRQEAFDLETVPPRSTDG